jgi:hypothetical protein
MRTGIICRDFGLAGRARHLAIIPFWSLQDIVRRPDLDHLPASKQRELERLAWILFEQFEERTG